MWDSIIGRGLDWLFPEHCAGCGQTGNPLCSGCAALLPAPRDLESPGMLAALPYSHPWTKKLIWRLKYYRSRHLADRLAEIIGEKLLEELAEVASYSVGDLADGTAEKWLLVPAPASSGSRGYNQAELIAKHLARQYGDFLEYRTGTVIKIRDTLPQAKILNRKKRLENLIGAFAVTKPKQVYGRRVIIVDDVITTGATVGEIKKVLRAAGARVVLAVALAHG